MKKVILIGYSGHAFVVCDVLLSKNLELIGYCETSKKEFNPYSIRYFGSERLSENLNRIQKYSFFTAIGDNRIRKKVNEFVSNQTVSVPINAIHKNASISPSSSIGNGIMIGDGSIVNACSVIGNGVICNTQSVIEHECKIADYVHIAPGAILCGNVWVGENSFVGARAVIKQGVRVGKNVTIGAGTVVIRDVSDNSIVVGNPQKHI